MANGYKGQERRLLPEGRRELGWHLDKKVPISILVILIVQTISFVVFLTKMDSRVENNSTYIEKVDQKAIAAFKHSQSMNERLARIEERTQHTVRLLERMENREDRVRDAN